MDANSSIEILGIRYECLQFEGNLWFSQKVLAQIFNVTKQNISLHVDDLTYGAADSISRVLEVAQWEGGRLIKRMVKHFDVKCAAEIALKGGRYEIHREFLRIALLFGVSIPELPIRPKKETEFTKLLLGLMGGIVDVKVQHRFDKFIVDYYLPEYLLVVEYDESHHALNSNRQQDLKRQNYISEKYGVSFVRVPQGEEISGLNAILKRLHAAWTCARPA